MNARRGMWRTERPARGRIAIGKAALAVCALTMACLCHAAILDSIRFGDAGSERAHAFSGEETLVVAKNSSGPRGRRIRKPKEDSWQSAPMSFRLKVDPHEKNYITVKFWGGDVTHDHLVMFIDGKQMGYMHLGDYDILDYEQCEPRDAPRSANPSPQYAGRFTYTTFLLPEAATKGKRSIDVAIRATGKIWGYGNNFGQFQKNVTQDSRRICSVHIHSPPYFAPDETNEPPPAPPSAEIPDVDLDAVKSRVDEELKRAMNADPTRDPDRLVFLAEAYHVEWCAAYRNPKVVRFALAAIDDLARRYASEPEKVVQRGSWSNCERQATALILLESALRPHFDEAIDDGRGDLVPRRELWCDMFEAAAFQLARDRRWLANQSQIVDNSGHRCNRATHILDDRRGLPLSVTLRFLKESLGILP